VIAAALAYLASEQGHAVGLMTMSDGKLAYVPARGGRPHLRALLARIDRLVPSGTWDPARTIARGEQLLQRRGVVMVISDFYDDEDATRREMRHVVQRGHDVAMLQLVSRPEMELSFAGQVEIEDLESGERRLIDPATTAARYRSRMAAFLDRCRGGALRDGVDYALFMTDAPPQAALRDYLLRRERRSATHAAPRANSASGR